MRTIIVAVSGKMRRGKDTIADYLVHKYAFQRAAFGDKLKDICMNYDNSTTEARDRWNVQIAQDLYPNEDISVAQDVDEMMQYIQPGVWRPLTYEECYGEKTDFSRRVMQQIGEGARNIRSQADCWVQYLLSKCVSQGGRFVICDMRYKNEAFLVESIEHSQIWRVERDMEDLFGSDHISEIDLDDYPFEVVIDNNGTVEQLHAKIDKVVTWVLRGDRAFTTGDEVY